MPLLTLGYREWKDVMEVARAVAAVDGYVLDCRFMPFAKPWSMQTFRDALGNRYAWAKGLGNEHYKGGPVRLHDPEKWVIRLRSSMDQGRTVVLLCCCADLASCHLTSVLNLLRARWGVCEAQRMSPPKRAEAQTILF